MPETKKPTPASFDLKQLDQLAKWLESTGLEEVEIETHGTRLRLRKPGMATTVAMPAPQSPVAAAGVQTATPNPQSPIPNPAEFKSPMVGTFYRSSSPDSAPFVKEGDKVAAGQTLGIIEAMKTMNQIEADRAGTVTKILVQNAQAVEYGQPLFIIQ